MKTHFITSEMYRKLVDGEYDKKFDSFVADRATEMVSVINAVAGESRGKSVIAALHEV
jgi:hypothetical protein